MNTKVNYYLDRYNLHEHLNENLKENISLKVFKKDTYICKLNEKLDYFYFLVEGKAKVSTFVSNGRSILLCISTPLSVIGDLEFLNMSLADCNVITIEECTCLVIPLSVVNKYASSDCNFLRFVINMLEVKMRNNSSYSSINLLYPLENRFASYLMSIKPTDTNNDIVEIENLTDVAELLGTSYRHLNRIIKKFADDGIIVKERRKVTIINKPALENLVAN